MFPFKSSVVLDRNSSRNLYLQLCDQIIGLIKSGKLSPSIRLPGTRKLAEDLNVHRKTVIAAYDELMAQGWIETQPSRGTYVTATLPLIVPSTFTHGSDINKDKIKSDFSFINKPDLINYNAELPNDTKVILRIDDGSPDHRLAPIEEIARTYRNITKKSLYQDLLAYGSTYGNNELREALVDYLNQTRGLDISINNILITRGSQMGIYLASQLLFTSGQKIIVGDTNYLTANNTFKLASGIIETVSVDDQGIDTSAIEALCRINDIKAVYVTSHHHHPTTVTLSAERRMYLLQLAKKYHFAIIEDDYDYDFHYSHAPILPLASNDIHGNVIYIGGFTKTIAPAIRVGYMIASKDFIDEAARLRRVIDRQGDMILEQTLAKMIRQGDIQRHCNKVLKIYKQRRDLFCFLLKERLGNYFDFEIPKGGMAVWVKLDKKYHWDDIVNKAATLGLELNPEWRRYDPYHLGHNGIRMGFASVNEKEIYAVIERLQKIFNTLE